MIGKPLQAWLTVHICNKYMLLNDTPFEIKFKNCIKKTYYKYINSIEKRINST